MHPAQYKVYIHSMDRQYNKAIIIIINDDL